MKRKKENRMKPGYKTTEFWLAAFSYIGGLLVLLGVVNQAEADQIFAAAAQMVQAAAALIIAIAPLLTYIRSRAELKRGQEQG